MANITEQDEQQERARLAEVIAALRRVSDQLGRSVEESAAEIQQNKELIWERQRDMDHAEKANIRLQVDESIGMTENADQMRRRIDRLISSPYFGRVDFHRRNEDAAAAHYIGLHSFRDPDTQEVLVHDWRAPVSSLFYDFETGEARYRAPAGVIDGEITGKRQYKIEDGQLRFMLESTLNIGDAVLQEELSRTSDSSMRNIVATIQREQNEVIRNEDAEVLILQGVAGSGKTSIALHRVAFLLYRFKDTVSAQDVMILSPNKVFGDYISNVLPELGEEQVPEVDAETIARRFLDGVVDFETFGEQIAALLEDVDEAVAERIRFKSTPEFLAALDGWIDRHADQAFTPTTVSRQGEELSAEWAAERFAALEVWPILTRMERLAEQAVQRLKSAMPRRRKWTAADARSVRKQVAAMFPERTGYELYRAFFRETGREEMFVPAGRRRIEYADVFPLIHTMLRTARLESPYAGVRHLVVDEMQDYTPVQYAVLKRLFDCRMTILGDANQSVNPYSSSSQERIRSVFPDAQCLELNRSYRSTLEITEFAQQISRNEKLAPVERHGPAPQVLSCADVDDELARVAERIEEFRRGEQESLGIICKTVEHARAMHRSLAELGTETTLLDYDSEELHGRVVITGAHVAKGLEFDAVVVPGVDERTYRHEIDKGMLYVACTRAMHELMLTHYGVRSPYLAFTVEPAMA